MTWDSSRFKKGQIVRDVGMLLDTEDQGQIRLVLNKRSGKLTAVHL